MIIESIVNRAMRRGWFRATTLATAALALLLGALSAPAAAVDADPHAPFQLPSFPPGGQWSELFSGPGDADYLRSGGVACEKPDPLPASNAGSGHGYRVPFTMALTDGRAIAGYSSVALAADQFPFGGDAYGITGWVRGWVELPSLRVSIPEEGTTLCSPSGAVWAGLPSSLTFVESVAFDGVGASPDFPAGASNRAWSEVVPAGRPEVSISGLTSKGALEFSASMPVEVHVKQGDSNDCTFELDLSLGTAKGLLPTSFPKLEGILPSDHSFWRSEDYFDQYYENPFDMKATPPDHYYMPPRALGGAIAGQTAAVANATMTMPVAANVAQSSGPCANNPNGSGFAGQFRNIFSPRSDENGSTQPAMPRGPRDEQGKCILFVACNIEWSALMQNGPIFPSFEMPSGSVQTSVDVTIADIALPQGLPAGYGFS